MFTSDRREEIKKLIMQNKRVDVSELSSQFQVSEVTIRKDLMYLEKAGILIRTHGGAILPEALAKEHSALFSEASPLNENEQAIALTVSCLIGDYDLIYLGCGSLCTEIAKELKNKPGLNVLTNNINAAYALAANPNINILTPPGNFTNRQNSCLLTGSDTLEFLREKYVDKAIFCPDAINYKQGFLVQDPDIANIYRSISKNADEIILAAASDTFNRNAFVSFHDLDSVHKVISDPHMPEDYITYFFDHSIQVFTSYNLENL
ncbi:MAG: DeoR/GlpR family DNA-binding transcription regulator [Blautia sp.]|jgi:DeoR family fructose operon transcriptional repressor